MARAKGARRRSSSDRAACAATQLSLSGWPAAAAFDRAPGSAAANAAAEVRASLKSASRRAASDGSVGRASTATSTGRRGSIASADRRASEGSPCEEGVAQPANIRTGTERISERIIGRCLGAPAYSRNCFEGAGKGLRVPATAPMSPPACAPVAQLDRASDYESEGRTFESFRARQSFNPAPVAGFFTSVGKKKAPCGAFIRLVCLGQAVMAIGAQACALLANS